MSLGSGVIPAWLIDTEIDRQLAQTRGNYKENTMFDLDILTGTPEEHMGSDQDAPGEFIQLDDDIENEVDVDEY